MKVPENGTMACISFMYKKTATWVVKIVGDIGVISSTVDHTDEF